MRRGYVNEHRRSERLTDAPRTLMKPMSLARSRKHWRQMSRPYLRMRPQWLAHTRLHSGHTTIQLVGNIPSLLMLRAIRSAVCRTPLPGGD